MSEEYECVCERCGEVEMSEPWTFPTDWRRITIEEDKSRVTEPFWACGHRYLLCCACWQEVKAYVEEGDVGVTVGGKTYLAALNSLFDCVGKETTDRWLREIEEEEQSGGSDE